MKKRQGNILIVDDNQGILRSLALLLKKTFENVETVSDPERIPAIFQEKKFEIVLLDMNFRSGVHSGNEGIYWLKKIKELDPQVEVILITAYGDIQLAVKAIKEGAHDFIQKPWDPDKLIVTMTSAYDLKTSREEVVKLKSRNQALKRDLNRSINEIIGNSESMQKVFNLVNKVSETDANVLILGENGTGKELIAREIHNRSPRSKEAFVGVDLGSLSESLFESELFGYLKGSFTDAHEDRIGRFESAEGGTLFLDEIGNLPLSLQPKILSVLQNREVVRIGANKPLAIDIRLISATNMSISEMISQKLFREDLYFRLNTIEIELPPLRERGNDIILLAEYFLKKYRQKYNKPDLKLTENACDNILKYKWPGNVRELKHSMERLVILSSGDRIEESELQFGRIAPKQADFPSFKLDDVEKQLIERVVNVYNGNMSKVAREMQISRTTLYAKMKKYGL